MDYQAQELKTALDELEDALMVDFDASLRLAMKMAPPPSAAVFGDDMYKRIARDYYQAGVQCTLNNIQHGMLKATGVKE